MTVGRRLVAVALEKLQTRIFLATDPLDDEVQHETKALAVIYSVHQNVFRV